MAFQSLNNLKGVLGNDHACDSSNIMNSQDRDPSLWTEGEKVLFPDGMSVKERTSTSLTMTVDATAEEVLEFLEDRYDIFEEVVHDTFHAAHANADPWPTEALLVPSSEHAFQLPMTWMIGRCFQLR